MKVIPDAACVLPSHTSKDHLLRILNSFLPPIEQDALHAKEGVGLFGDARGTCVSLTSPAAA